MFDCFLASNELDMMEIRLRELEQVVDEFVVLESRMSFRGRHRALHFPKVLSRLPAAVLTKTKYVVLDHLEGEDAWAKETYQRDALFRVGLKHVHPQPGDIIIVSDCDEIPRPSFVAAMRQCEGVQFPVGMQATHHYYSFGLRAINVDKVWNQPKATVYTSNFKESAHQVRASQTRNIYPNSSWHCSTCFRSIAAVQTKISSFSHVELDKPSYNNPEAIVKRVQEGKDLFDREMLLFAKDESGDMPSFIAAHPTRFSYLISRDVADAGFKDLGMPAGSNSDA